jgi:NADPH:quinone reductase-like Zn-dependent oxidoreductase
MKFPEFSSKIREFTRKGFTYAAVATRSSRRTFRCHSTQHGLRTGSWPGGCPHLDGSGAAQSIGLSVRPWHLWCQASLSILTGCRGCRPSCQHGIDVALQSKRVLILPTYEQGTWADQVVVPVRNIVPMSDEADPLQLSMIGINPATAYLLLNRYVSLMPGDWIGQTAANSAMGQYIIALAKLAGVKTLNVVRREEAAEQVRQFGGDRVVIQGDNLLNDIEEALDGKKLSLVLDSVGGTPVGDVAKSLKNGGSIVVYALQSGEFPVFSPGDFIYRGLSLHGFWLINWIRNAPRTEIQEIYQKLGDLVADGSLSAVVETVYALEQFKEAFDQSLKSNRSGKILFKFGATH